jgi:hypothetical protein
MNKALWISYAICASLSTVAHGKSGNAPTVQSPTASQRCDGLTGNALERCRRELEAGLSGDAATRYGGTSPGSTGDTTARPSKPPPRSDNAMQDGK